MPDDHGITGIAMSVNDGETVTIDIDDLDTIIDALSEDSPRGPHHGAPVGQITVDGEKLCQALNAITPHVGEVELSWIRIAIAADVQIMATDRYSLALARIDGDAIYETDHDVWHVDIRADDAKLIAAIFKPGKDDQASIRLRATTTDLTVTDVSGLLSGRELSVEATFNTDALDSIPRLIGTSARNMAQAVITTATAALWVVSPHQWAKFVKSAACYKREPFHIESHEPGKPFLITIGTHFIGLLATHKPTSADNVDEHRDTVQDWLDLLPDTSEPAAA